MFISSDIFSEKRWEKNHHPLKLTAYFILEFVSDAICRRCELNSLSWCLLECGKSNLHVDCINYDIMFEMWANKQWCIVNSLLPLPVLIAGRLYWWWKQATVDDLTHMPRETNSHFCIDENLLHFHFEKFDFYDCECNWHMLCEFWEREKIPRREFNLIPSNAPKWSGTKCRAVFYSGIFVCLYRT